MKKLLPSLIMLLSTSSFAGSFGVMTGYYSLNSKSGSKSATVSALGSYRFFYHHEIRPNFIADLSYTVLFEKSLGGDSSYGFDIGGSYFPFQRATSSESQLDNVTIKIEPKYSPYIGLGYHQRQYQSIRSAYSGPGIKAGTIYSYSKSFNIIGEARYISLSGPVSTTATELSTNIGVVFKY